MFVIPEELDKKLTQLYNKSQYQAIALSLKQEGITLIQGPPGTGKTKTVLGTLSVLLQSSTSKDD
jgi:type II secretory ATPase GspE/PulE/Tfp pilus assembly ATPase PilB-like protein